MKLLHVLCAALALCCVVPTALAESTEGTSSAPHGRINIDLHRADLRTVLRLLADVGGVNLVVAEGVEGQLTMRLRQVHWRDALRTVLSLHGLKAEIHDNILHVATAEHFARRRAVLLSAREQCLATAPLRTRLVRVSHADANNMAALVAPTLSARGSVAVDARTNTLIIRDVRCD